MPIQYSLYRQGRHSLRRSVSPEGEKEQRLSIGENENVKQSTSNRIR